MNTDVMINVDHVSFWYERGELILDDVVMEIRPPARVALVGRNGSGKTTLIETILGLNIPVKGKVSFPKELSKSIGCVFQDVDFDGEASLSKTFLFFTKLARISNSLVPDFSKEQLSSIFAKYELTDKLNKSFSSLSSGQKQKFKLLLCLELKPKVLILDELTTSLDFEWRKKIINLIKQYLSDYPETTLIFVSHSGNEIETLTNEYYLLQDRKIKKVTDLTAYFKE